MNEILKISENNSPDNTDSAKMYIWSQFNMFCASRNYVLDGPRPYLNSELLKILRDWTSNITRADGTLYKHDYLKLFWNTITENIKELYYNKYGIILNPITQLAFEFPRKLKKSTDKRVLTNTECLKINNLFNEDTPDGLQAKFFYIAGLELGWRGEEAAKCGITHFNIELDSRGVETGRIAYNPVFSKNGEREPLRLAKTKWLTPNTKNPSICPVR